MAKSLRTAFIRVSKTNNTENGLIEYTYDDIQNIVKEWSKSKSFYYYIKDHNNEIGDENTHYHIVLKFNAPTPFDDIKKIFPYGLIENAKSIKNCVQYLVHMNDLSKTQYNFDEIITNDTNINKYRYQSVQNQLLKLDEFIHKIDIGEIREYNLTDTIPIDIFTNHKTKILNALEFYRRKVMTNKDRNIQVMIFSGDTGTYKTTYAKQFAQNQNKSICISSSSNDPMQDYAGEDILVLDDLRDVDFKFHDLLKVLDNHTKSTVASRYNNKAFIGDTIIITTSQPISEWYFDESKEDKEQLYRRVPIQMQFTKEKITVFQYNEKAHKYVFVYELPNVNKFTPQDTKAYILDTLDNMGVVMSDEIRKKIINAQINPKYENKEYGEISNEFNDDLFKLDINKDLNEQINEIKNNDIK